MSASGGAQSTAVAQTWEGQVEELIPGIPNEVTLDQITTMLKWIDIDSLALVSRGWCHAIRSRKVYDARVRSGALGTLIMAESRGGQEHVIQLTLYKDLSDVNTRLALPPLTSEFYAKEVAPLKTVTFDGREYYTPREDKIVHRVTLDGKVYVLWGLDGKVNVLDVAGHRQWKQCADMLKPRQEFRCGSIAGKLYVHGGRVDFESGGGTEVYNPKEKTWTKIRTIVPLRSSRRAGRRRKEIFWRVGGDWPSIPSQVPNDDPLEVYGPMKDEWRVVTPVGTHMERMFVAGEKFYSMSLLGIQIYDFDRDSWGELHSFSFAGIAPDDIVEISPVAILTVEAELLAIVDWRYARRYSSCLVLSSGLSSQNEEIVWHKPNYSDTKFPRHASVNLPNLGINL